MVQETVEQQQSRHTCEPFLSILFEGEPGGVPELATDPPSCFGDLNLDQIVDTLTSDRGQYDLKPYFFTPLTSVEAIQYRHEILHDLDDDSVRECVNTFAGTMRQMREQSAAARKMHDARQQEFWLLAANRTYQTGVGTFAKALETTAVNSAGLSAFCAYLQKYVRSAPFIALVGEADELERTLDQIRYDIQLDGSKVTVTDYADEPDYSREVEETFAKFQQGDVSSHLVKYNEYLELNQVESRILALVAQLNPEAFQALDRYSRVHADYLDPTIARFDREVQFYLAYIGHTKRLTADGLSFCYPQVSDSKAVHASDIFDLALAGKLVPDHEEVITNGFELNGRERVIVVTGANQGGKTTFSRTFGQLHYLAALGLPVPGTEASLFLFDRLFTHYEKEEDIHGHRSKLEDDLVRIHDILARATGDSIVIMNEIFTSTTLDDAITLGTAVLKQIIERDILSVCVTFVDELSTLSETTVSMVAAVDPAEPASRTYKLVRKPADGLAYAVAIAEKYGLSYARLKERIAS